MSGHIEEESSGEPLYLTYAQPELHPARLGAVAALSGVSAARPHKCTYLELGCGDGGNLLPLAESYPDSVFIGVDGDARAVAVAHQRIAQCRLTNVSISHSDLRTYAVQPNFADYIVCHGVFSWVPPDVADRVLSIISHGLTTSGVGYVSYNVLPGWRTRGVLRDIMKFGVALGREAAGTPAGDTLTPENRLKYGAQFLTFVSGIRQDPDDTYGVYLREAIARLQHADLPYLVNEYLGEFNEPVTFIDFLQTCAGHELAYLGEARPALLFSEDVGERFDTLMKRSQVGVQYREQALDFCRNRMFRETLLCRKELGIECRASELTALPNLFYTTEYTPILPNSQDLTRSEVGFINVITGREVTVAGGHEAQVLSVLGTKVSEGLSIDEVVGQMEQAGPGKLERSQAESIFLSLLKRGFVDIWSSKLPIAKDLHTAAKLSSFALTQATLGAQTEGGSVTTVSHRTLPLSANECAVLQAANEVDSILALTTHPPLQQQFSSDAELRDTVTSLHRRALFRAP